MEATITLSLADYRILLDHTDELNICECCGAWMTHDECASVEDLTACWRYATGNEKEPCYRHRSIDYGSTPQA